jgi:hypothetical protein
MRWSSALPILVVLGDLDFPLATMNKEKHKWHLLLLIENYYRKNEQKIISFKIKLKSDNLMFIAS